jgi:RimJ/RimL family protein N-acetyltransferase
MERCVPELTGKLVRLEPLRTSHSDGLVVAAGEDRASYGYTTVPLPEDVATYVTELVAAAHVGDDVPFVQIRLADGRPVGVTRFVRFRPFQSSTPFAVEIGGTWLAPSAQRTGINVEAKLMLLDHAFDVWDVRRVDFTTDARNGRSRAAIAALGARCEGILRSWGPSRVAGEEGQLRDTAIYAILASEWPAVRRTLASRLRLAPE